MASLFVVLMALGPLPSPNLKTDSTTDSSVAVVSRPGLLVSASALYIILADARTYQSRPSSH